MISEFPKEVAADALNRKPNKMTEYIISLVKVFHSYYNSTKVNNPDDPELTNQRLGLIKATMITLKNALQLIGVSARRPCDFQPVNFSQTAQNTKIYNSQKSNRTTADLAADTSEKEKSRRKAAFLFAFQDFRQRYFQFFGLFLGVFPSIHYFFHSRRIFPAGFLVLLRN